MPVIRAGPQYREAQPLQNLGAFLFRNPAFSGHNDFNDLSKHTISLAKRFRFVFVSFGRFGVSRETVWGERQGDCRRGVRRKRLAGDMARQRGAFGARA
jgi:hypothetical protein